MRSLSFDLAASKLRLRKKIRGLKLSSSVRKVRGIKLCRKIQKSRFFQDAAAIGFYAALPDEIDVFRAAETALKLGKKVFFPKMKKKSIEFFQVFNLKNSFKSGAHGVMEPVAKKKMKRIRALDLVLVPGRAFDKKGGRLGRGGGHYDRLLEKWPSSVRMGVAFREQVVRFVPCEPHDIRMDVVMSA